MADKSFEQQVQENLSGLRMKPDTAVWQEVERALHKERKRRWLIWLLLLAAGTAASFWGYDSYNRSNTNLETKNTIHQTQLSKQLAKPEKDNVLYKQPINTVTESQPIGNTANPVTTDRKNVVNKSFAINQKNKKINQQIQSVTPATEMVINKEAKQPSQQKSADETVKNDESTAKGTVQKATQVENTMDSSQTPAEIKSTERPTPIQTDTAANTRVNKVGTRNKKNPWQWHINAVGGNSGLRDGLSFTKASSSDLATAAPGTGSGNVTPPAASAIVAPTIKDAFSLGVQMEATKKIGKRNSIGISAGYLLLQNQTSIGRRIDSTAFSNAFQAANSNGYYYRSTDSIGYTNQYHFLQLGVNLYMPFRLFKAASLRWQLGTGVNFLIATNGLHYDAANGRLFQNSSLYNKVQPYISSGFDIAVGKQPFLYLGPHWLYNFSTLTKQGGKSQHLSQFAVQASFVLPKKKNKMQR